VSRLVPREAVLVDSVQDAEKSLPELLATRILGADCEGVSLGRWGRLCICQIATPHRVYIFDALRSGIVNTLRPALESPATVKVMHDCREDSSALFSQFAVRLAHVFDTQVAHTLLLEQQRHPRPYQISLHELLKMHTLTNEKQGEMTTRMEDDANVWFYRPLDPELISYAAQDVMYLPLLHWLLCDKLGDPSGSQVLLQSQRYVDYAEMNTHLASPKAVEKRGLRLRAMLATKTESSLYFKLNLGAHRQGAATRPDAVSRYDGMKCGDVAECWVSAWNTNGHVVFLERIESLSDLPVPKINTRRRRTHLRTKV